MSKTNVLMACCVAVIAAAVGWALVRPQEPPSFKARVDAVASTLRCPVCESLSVKDSTSDVAQEMRARIEAGMRAGRSPEEIERSFVAAYGESVRLAPEPKGVNLIAWVVPVIALLGGGAIAVSVVRRWARAGGER